MFGLFKKKEPFATQDLHGVVSHLKDMGYSLLAPSGYAVAALDLASRYTPAETASHIALVTMALDVKEADSDYEKLMVCYFRATELLRLLKNHKDNGSMRKEVWQNDSTALYRVAVIDAEQEEWIEKVLSDPAAKMGRLAVSSIAPSGATHSDDQGGSR